MKRQYILLLVAFLEGFTTLAFQMVALRKAIPFVGSSIVLTSVVIGVILLALSAGYYFGGALTRRLSPKALMVRLASYLLISSLYYLLIVYPSFSRVLTTMLRNFGFVSTLFGFSLVFFALPTFLASHTMPIITHIIEGTKGYAAGKILFISTLGSFLGSTVTTLLLFPHLGVYWTGIAASLLLFMCGVLVLAFAWRDIAGKKVRIGIGAFFVIIFSIGTYFFSIRASAHGRYQETPYQTIEVIDFDKSTGMPDTRLLKMNGGWASSILHQALGKQDPVEDVPSQQSSGGAAASGNRQQENPIIYSIFPYIRYSVDIVKAMKPHKIAVIGAAGCTLPQEIAQYDFVDRIDVVDIDSRVFDIAEDVFLQQKLHKKITPIVQSARGRLYDREQRGEKYDMIFIDVYNGFALPDEVLTQEFFSSLHGLSKHILMNVITDMQLESTFSRGLLATIESVFPRSYYTLAASYPAETQSLYQRGLGNILLSSFSFSGAREIPLYRGQEQAVRQKAPYKIYTDDKNNADGLRVQVIKELF